MVVKAAELLVKDSKMKLFCYCVASETGTEIILTTLHSKGTILGNIS